MTSIIWPSNPSWAAFQYAARTMWSSTLGAWWPPRSAASAVITAARANVASKTVSAAVAGTSATRISTVGNFLEGRTSQ